MHHNVVSLAAANPLTSNGKNNALCLIIQEGYPLFKSFLKEFTLFSFAGSQGDVFVYYPAVVLKVLLRVDIQEL